MKAFLGQDTVIITKEAAQDWLEKELMNINMNGKPSSNEYTINQIRSIINIPMRDGQSLLGKYLDWNNVNGVALLVKTYGAKAEAEHFNIIREKLTDPYLQNVAQDMLRLLDEAQGQVHVAAEPDPQMAEVLLPLPEALPELPNEAQALDHADVIVIPREIAQDWLEREQFNIHTNGTHSSNEYTIDQIRSFINTPMRDGQSLLSKYLDWNSINGVASLVKTYGARVEIEHFNMVREKLTNPALHNSAQNMLGLLEEAQEHYIEQTPLRDLTLSDAIKFHPRLADKLLSEGWVVNLNTIMMDLVDAIARGNHGVIKILLKHNVQIDWNQQIKGDLLGDSLMMKLAKDPVDFGTVAEYITMKDSNGLPIFKVNQENNNSQKLIDIFKSQLDQEGQVHMPIINLLRACGSSEPNSKIIPETRLKLDIDNVHNALNEKPFHDIQTELHQGYDASLLDINQIFAQIREYVASNKEHLKALLGDEDGEAIEKGLTNLSHIEQSSDMHEHNNAWSTKQEVALVYLAAKKMGILEKFVEVLTEMHACQWGMVVNLYKIIENGNGDLVEFRPAIDLTDLIEDMSPLAEKVCSTLSTTMSGKMMEQIVVQFFQDITNSVKAKDYSVGTELVMGCFVTIFEQMVIRETGTADKICSRDIQEFLAVVENLVMSYDEDDNSSNPLYEIMYKNDHQVEPLSSIFDLLTPAVNFDADVEIPALGDSYENKEDS